MGDVRINVRTTRSANSDNLLLMVNDQIVDLSASDAEVDLKPGDHTVKAILTRKPGECGPVSCEVGLHSREGELIEALNVEVADWGDINQVRKTISIA